MPDTGQQATGGASGAGVPVVNATCAWSYNPWRANWRRPALALLLELAVAALAGWSFSAPAWWPQAFAWGVISFALLSGMTAMVFLPVRYKLSAAGVAVHLLGAPSFRKWEHYRNYYVHKTGVHLTTMPKPSALDPFRGHYLQFGVPGGPGARERVVPFIEEHLRPFIGQTTAP
jgi:hypothetical protein